METRERGPLRSGAAPQSAPDQDDAFDRSIDREQQMLLDHQAEHELRMQDIEERRAATKMRYLIEGMVIFGLISIFGGPLGMAIGTAYGAGVGYVAWRTGGGAISFGLVGSVAWVIYWVLFGPSIYSVFLCVGLCTVLGCAHEMQKYDGSEC